MAEKTQFRTGQQVKFVDGCFKGRLGVVQFVGDSGRVFVKITGYAPDFNGRRAKLQGTFADPSEIAPA